MSSASESTPTETVTVSVSDGDQLWAQRSGAGRPIVLLHGSGIDSRLWNGVFEELARDHTVIRYDARGLGHSAVPTRPFSDVADLVAILDHFGIDQAALAGMSMGGETSLDFALTEPSRVSSLMLVGSSLGGYEWSDAPELDAYAQARRDRDWERLIDLELEIWAAMGTDATGGDVIAAMVEQNAHRRVDTERFMTTADHNTLSILDRIMVPTLVLHGDRDHPEIATIADQLEARIPYAVAQVVADADHYLPLRVPGELARLLRSHLAQ